MHIPVYVSVHACMKYVRGIELIILVRAYASRAQTQTHQIYCWLLCSRRIVQTLVSN